MYKEMHAVPTLQWQETNTRSWCDSILPGNSFLIQNFPKEIEHKYLVKCMLVWCKETAFSSAVRFFSSNILGRGIIAEVSFCLLQNQIRAHAFALYYKIWKECVLYKISSNLIFEPLSYWNDECKVTYCSVCRPLLLGPCCYCFYCVGLNTGSYWSSNRSCFPSHTVVKCHHLILAGFYYFCKELSCHVTIYTLIYQRLFCIINVAFFI